jgi:hypothetical protein
MKKFIFLYALISTVALNAQPEGHKESPVEVVSLPNSMKVSDEVINLKKNSLKTQKHFRNIAIVLPFAITISGTSLVVRCFTGESKNILKAVHIIGGLIGALASSLVPIFYFNQNVQNAEEKLKALIGN